MGCRKQWWGVLAVIAAVAVLITMSGCRNELLDAEENESELDTYTVTFEKQGGIGGSVSVTAIIGQPMPTGLAPTKAGAVFDGYYTRLYTAPGGTGTQYYTAEMESARNWDISTDVELVAHWAYQIGDTGQAGGIVFYDKGEYTQGWRYLEAWTTNEDGMHAWKLSSTYTSGTVTDVGSGYDNTYTAMSGAEHPAAEVVRNATHGGYEDWFLPSLDELDLMYENLHKEDIGDFVPGDYWSSSEYDENQAWFQIFANGNQHDYSKTYGGSVRAARAF